MNGLINYLTVRREQDFEVYFLSNGEIELGMVPELGAKIISLKNVKTGREWLWHPTGGLRLFHNRMGDDFCSSPLVGVDECLPTIAPCRWRRRELPDHGELWSQPWSVDPLALKDGILKTTIELKISPFKLERTIELRDREVHIYYHLSNLGATEEHFLWALHPLLRLEAGDHLELPPSTRALLDGETWVDAISSTIPPQSYAKGFAGPIHEGSAAITNSQTGDRLEFVWDPRENNVLGLWLTRGGWHGHHHFALEPMNAGHDSLALAAERKKAGTIAGHSCARWRLCLRVS